MHDLPVFVPYSTQRSEFSTRNQDNDLQNSKYVDGRRFYRNMVVGDVARRQERKKEAQPELSSPLELPLPDQPDSSSLQISIAPSNDHEDDIQSSCIIGFTCFSEFHQVELSSQT